MKLELIKRLFAINKIPEGIPVDIFDEIGSIQGELKIHLNEGAVPVIQPPRRIPHAMMSKLKTELERMQSLGVIIPVEEPTDWVSSLVIQSKSNGQIRICLDPKHLNQAIKRQHYPIPTTEDIIDKLVGGKVFSKLDCSSGYWQIKVSNESSKLLCFNSPFGRYCFTRLPFGIHIASEVFQQKLETVLEGLAGVANSQDDMIVWGADQKEHDIRLKKVMETLYTSGFRLNKDKCRFSVKDLIFLGHRITDRGIYPDPEKIAAVSTMSVPSDKKAVQRLLGMVNYLSKFIPDVSEITAPLRKLIEKDTKFEINKTHLDSIQKIKQILTSNPVLQVFDSSKETKIGVDASMNGLGAVLLQQTDEGWLPVAYASRSLTPAEKRYAQIEKECLAAVFGCKKFHVYVYGRPFMIENDHKPLQTIIKKDMCQMPARITRMMLELIRYPDLTFKYIPGSQLKIPDTLSRAPQTSSEDAECPDIETQVHAVYKNVPANDDFMQKFADAVSSDQTMTQIKEYLTKGWPEHKDCPKHMEHYWSIRDEITEIDGILFKAVQMIVPQSLRPMIKEKIHIGHLGIVKCKERAKTYFYWPGMSKDIEQLVYKCGTCQEYRNKLPKEPNMEVKDNQPWSTIGCDIFHMQQNHYLIMVDYYSSFPEVILLSKGVGHGTSLATIEKMKQTFAIHGIPHVVISDGGPQFTSHQFQEFSKEWGFKHEPSSPHYPRGNGRTERTVQTIKKLITKAVQTKSSVDAAILAYRTTPLQDCHKSPAELLLGRIPRNHLNNHLVPQGENQTNRSYDSKYSNLHAKELPALNDGDKVRIHNGNKWAKRAVVIQKHRTPRSYVVKSEDGGVYRRNRQHLMKTEESFKLPTYHGLLDDDIEYIPDHHVNTPIDPIGIPLPDSSDNDLLTDDDLENHSDSLSVGPISDISEDTIVHVVPPPDVSGQRHSSRNTNPPVRLEYGKLGQQCRTLN